jgi:LGFP repeat
VNAFSKNLVFAATALSVWAAALTTVPAQPPSRGAILVRPQGSPIKPTNLPAPAPPPGGLIGEKWRAMGGARSILGRAVTEEKADSSGRDRYVQFENGMIAWSPGTGPKSLQVIYRSGNSVIFEWGSTSPFNYDKFIVRYNKNERNIGQQDVGGSRTSGRFELRNTAADQTYSFAVEGADDGDFSSGGHSIARQGWSAWVSVGEPVQVAPTTPVNLSVSSSGKGASSSYAIKGTGFQPNGTVSVRVVDDTLKTLYFTQRASASGVIDLKQPIPTVSGLPLHFSATDGRPDPRDVTGMLWSNTVTLVSP